MKTVIDAVNALEGDIKNVIVDDDRIESFASIILCVDSYNDYLSGEYHNWSDKDCEDLLDSWQLICTVDEFNACVDELSAATWIDGISLEEWKAEMKNMVIDSNGNELEIGKVYEFSDNQTSWNLYALKGCNNVADDDNYEYEANNCNWKFIRECQSPLGTIKKAPVKLVDGKAYQFESRATGRVWVGFYNSTNDRFDESVGGDGSHCFIGDVSDFKNIIPLVPEIK